VEAENFSGDWSPETGADLPHAVGFGLLSMDPGKLTFCSSEARDTLLTLASIRGERIRRTELGPPRNG
jgi:hypothetical protein